ncbi:MAG: hypothetical protein ACOX1O_01820 [Eggerthellaceae bacterium]
MIGPQDFNDLVALCSLIVAAIVCFASLVRGQREDNRDDQSLRDRLDNIKDTVDRSLKTIQEVDTKLGRHEVRIALIEEREHTLFRRLESLERTVDRCDTCHKRITDGRKNDD